MPANATYKNILSLSLTEILARGISFFLNIYFARVFSLSTYGEYGFAATTINFFILFSNFGLDTYMIARYSSNISLFRLEVSKILNIKILLSIISITLLFAFSFTLENSAKLLLLTYGLLILSNILNMNWYFQAVEKMKYILFFKSIESLLFAVLTFSLIQINKSVFSIPISLFIAQLLVYIFAWKFIKLQTKISFEFDFHIIKNILPIGLSSFLIMIYYHIDIIILQYFRGEIEVAVYNASVKIFLFAIAPLSIILNIYFPKFSKVYAKEKQNIVKLYYEYGLFLIITALVIFLILYFYSYTIIMRVYGVSFVNSIYSLRILSFNVLLVGINIMLGNPLIAFGKNKYYLIAISTGAISNLILNIIFIPSFGFIGASYITVISEMFVFLSFIIIHYKLLKANIYAAK